MHGLDKHYESVSDHYHLAWFYAHDTDYEHWMTRHILTESSLTESLAVCDLGGGTGRFAHLIHREGHLRHPVTCVDASEQMVRQAARYSGVVPVCKDMLGFVREASTAVWDRIVVKEAIHHIEQGEIEEFFREAMRVLKEKGKLLVVTRPQHEIDYPFTQRAKEIWAETQLDRGTYLDAVKKCGFSNAFANVREFPVKIKLEDWIAMVRARMWSVFAPHNFSDSQLEEAIQEIRSKVSEDEEGYISFFDRIVFIVAEK
jgi:ubiquinone/menaquinone biosynthesis C-methylase UbiE